MWAPVWRWPGLSAWCASVPPPGSAREIGAIFLAMGTGLIIGMGYLAYAFLCTILLGFASALYNHLDFGAKKRSALYKTLHITIPEDLDYTDVFEPILKKYAASHELTLSLIHI